MFRFSWSAAERLPTGGGAFSCGKSTPFWQPPNALFTARHLRTNWIYSTAPDIFLPAFFVLTSFFPPPVGHDLVIVTTHQDGIQPVRFRTRACKDRESSLGGVGTRTRLGVSVFHIAGDVRALAPRLPSATGHCQHRAAFSGKPLRRPADQCRKSLPSSAAHPSQWRIR